MMGGPSEYDDEKLKSVHSRFKITEVEWHKVLNTFTTTLKKLKLKTRISRR
jgi:truncated hemoglobin YjbI